MRAAKQFLSMLLTLCIVLSLLPSTVFAVNSNVPFTDVKETDWFYDSVGYVYENGMMSGTGNNQFSPNVATTRGMIVTILYRLEGSPAVSTASFDDVAAGEYYANGVYWAAANGVVSGYGNDQFGPNDPITREQMATILYRYAQYKEYETTVSGDVSSFTDGASVSNYAVEPMNWAVGTGLLSGVGNNMLNPAGNATRAEVATILMRFCELNSISSVDSHTVTFNYNYGDKGVYKTFVVNDGDRVEKPSTPSRSGYSFNGWYTESTGGTEFDFGTGVTTNLILYAHWKPNSNSGGGSTDPVYYYTVTFDVIASDVNNVPPTQQVRSGNSAVEPMAPSRSGYTFEGWYTDPTYTELYDFRWPVRSNITLYAKWDRTGSPDPGPGGDGVYRVTFDLNDDSSGVYEVQMVEYGGKASSPSAEPERELYRFTGWYEEPSGAVAYDFDCPVTDNLTLYAGWGSPDPDSDGLYAASNTEETVNSITGLFMSDNKVTATINVNSASVLLVEFFQDTLGDSWSKEAMDELLSGTPTVRIAAYTPEYGELINVSIPVETPLPEYYIARATLLSPDEDTELCEPFLYIEGSKQYKEFASKTITDYDPDQVINFDESMTTNFGVLVEGTKKITVTDITNKLTVDDIDIPDKLVPDHTYTFANPDASVTGLNTGDIVYIEGTQYLFKVESTVTNGDSSITIIPDNDATLEDFYSTLKVDMGSATDDGIQTMADIIDVDTTISKEFGFPSLEFHPKDWLTIKGNASFKEDLDIKIVYDFHLFGEDYFEFSLISKTSIEATVGVEAELKDHDGEDLEWDLLSGYGKVPIPTPIPGLEVYTKLSIPLDLDLTAGVSATWKGIITSGLTYNTHSGQNIVKDVEKTLEIKAEGKAEIKVGPEVALGVQISGEVVSAELNGSAGAKVSVAASVGDEDIWGNASSKHMCILCVDGEAKWFVEVHLKAEYNICDIFTGDFFDAKLFGMEGPVSFPGSRDGKFYISIIPGPDNVFSSNNTEDPQWFLGGGTCPNIAYRTELKAVNENEEELSGVLIRVLKNTGKVDETDASPCVLYLHDGVYTVSAAIDGTDVSRSVVVRGAAQTVFLSPNSGNKQLVGKIVDSTDGRNGIGGATIKISQDDLVIASATSDSNGDFKVTLPGGTFLVEVTKEGYIPFTIYQKVEDDQAATQMQTIEMIRGSGMGGFRGVITDATTGEPIEGVTLELRDGWENSTHGEVRKTLTTDSNGEFRYNTLDVLGTGFILGLECGNYTLTASKDGYIGTHFNIIVLPGATDAHPDQNASMAPAQAEGGDTWRIVLTWGENPRDLDSHVVGTLTTGNSFHVYYSHKSQYDGDLEVCNLDLDDVTSYGPETIMLNANNSTPYYYYIHRYAGSGTVASSGAQIKVYHGADVVRTFNVPTGLGDGDYWNVFAIVDGRLVVENTITDTANVTYAGAVGIMTISLDYLEEKKDLIETESGDNGNSEIAFVLADAQVAAQATVEEYEATKVAALIGQNAIDAAVAKATAMAAIDDSINQVGIDTAVDTYVSIIDTLITGTENLETGSEQTNEEKLEIEIYPKS